MLVFDELKFCYQPICRVGSSSFYKYIYPILINAGLLDGRLPAAEVRFTIDETFNITPDKLSVSDDYFTASLVRNPWHRAVSAYQRLMQSVEFGGKQHYYNNKGIQPYSNVFKLMNGDTSFESFIHYIKNIERNHNEWVDAHWRSQVDVLKLKPRVHEISYDFIGKLENIEEDCKHIANKIDGPAAFPKIRTSTPYDYTSYYTHKLIDDVGEYYCRDVSTFNYEPPKIKKCLGWNIPYKDRIYDDIHHAKRNVTRGDYDSTRQQGAARMQQQLELCKEDAVLDIGCGVGDIPKLISSNVHRVYCCDINRQYLDYAKENCKGISNMSFNLVEDLDRPLSFLSNSTITKAYAHAVLIHNCTEMIISYLHEIKRILKPGGLFYSMYCTENRGKHISPGILESNKSAVTDTIKGLDFDIMINRQHKNKNSPGVQDGMITFQTFQIRKKNGK